jgi:hypothetical protein
MIKRPWHYTFATLTILAAFALAGCDLFATPDSDEGHFTYRLESDHVVITGHTGNIRNRHIVIPSSIEGRPVTVIAPNAFRSKGIASVYIPDSVTLIRDSSFRDNRLTMVTIPPGASIGTSAFMSNRLESLYIPSDVSLLGVYIFAFNRLKGLTIAYGFDAMIHLNMFADNLLEEVVIPSSVPFINERAFIRNPLTSITLGADLEFHIVWDEENNRSVNVYPFGYGFEEFYIASGRRAGTYVRSSATSTDWRLLEE